MLQFIFGFLFLLIYSKQSFRIAPSFPMIMVTTLAEFLSFGEDPDIYQSLFPSALQI